MKRIGLVAFIIFVFVCRMQGQVVISNDGPLSINGEDLSCAIMEGETGLAEAVNAAFAPVETGVPSWGMSRTPVWIKFCVHNATQSSDFILKIANATMDRVELYAVDSVGSLVSEAYIDRSEPFFTRKYHNPNFKFDLAINPSETLTYYLKVESQMPIVLPISIVSDQVNVRSLSKEYFWLGIYAGIVIIMALYNLFLFLSIRDISYVHYVFYVLGTGLTQIGVKGYNFQFLWPNNPALEVGSVIFLGCFSGIAAILFTIHFLEIRKYFRALHVGLVSLLVLFCLALVVLIVDRYTAFLLMQTATTLSALFGLTTAIYVVYKRPTFPPAKFFLIAWSILLVGSLIFILRDYGILPHNALTNSSVQVASAIEMALLSFGLANRINMLKAEREQSRLDALHAAEKNEKLIREQNIVLEQKVEERTRALTETNESLQTTLAHLKEAQSQLVDAEKMASLGQLTAGVAHEINNPINFVTSNIGPLQRDIDMIWEAMDEVERIWTSDDLPKAAKLEKLQAYKTEIEIDYLRTEVEFLLKGMHEGASRTAEIVKSLRIFSRVDEDTLMLVNIHDGLESTLVILNSVMKENVSVRKQYADLPLVECHAGKLNQVFLNILSNALYAMEKKYGSSMGGELILETGLVDDDMCYISITDNGVGIPEDIRGKLFEPFFTTKDVGEGTGLGMSIAYTTIMKHQGRITVESELGLGSTFTIYLPVIQKK